MIINISFLVHVKYTLIFYIHVSETSLYYPISCDKPTSNIHITPSFITHPSQTSLSSGLLPSKKIPVLPDFSVLHFK